MLLHPAPGAEPLVSEGLPATRQWILNGRFELLTVDSFEPGQMFYTGRDGAEPTGRRRDLRFEFEIRDRDANVQRIFVRYPGGQESLFVEQRFTRAQ
jgi:hypothetical protein